MRLFITCATIETAMMQWYKRSSNTDVNKTGCQNVDRLQLRKSPYQSIFIVFISTSKQTLWFDTFEYLRLKH